MPERELGEDAIQDWKYSKRASPMLVADVILTPILQTAAPWRAVSRYGT